MEFIKGNFENALLVAKSTKQLTGIGTYREKTLHIFLKNYIEPNSHYHEVKVGKKYADIVNENGIIEIQTRSFNNLREKLEYLLNEYKVTIVYPYAALKWLIWLDTETGEISKKRKSPKKLSFYDSFYELYKIKQYLSHPNLNLYLLGMEMEEIRYLNGWSTDRKKGSERMDRFPISILEELHIKSFDDYIWLLPSNIPSPFTSVDYQKSANVSPRVTGYALNCLETLKIIKCVGKKDRKKLYEIV